MYENLEIGDGIAIPLYNLLIGIGLLLGFLYLENEIKHYNLTFKLYKNLYFAIIVAIFLGLIGAKLFELLYHNKDLIFLNFITGGITFMGGVLVGGISFFIANKVLGTKNLLAFNLFIPFLLISHFFGRIGCFFAGCCYGQLTGSIFGLTYPDNSLPSQHFGPDAHIHPTQLYEAVFLAILFFVIHSYVKFKFRIAIYLITYGIFRFIIENYRADNRGRLLTDLLSPSQLLSILFMGIGLWFYLKTKNKRTITTCIIHAKQEEHSK